MGCPRCRCEEISASGMCLWCGYQVNAPAEEPEPGPPENEDILNSIETDESYPPVGPAREELPQWRRELSQRLRTIKQMREASGKTAQAAPEILPVESRTPVSGPPGPSPDQSGPTVRTIADRPPDPGIDTLPEPSSSSSAPDTQKVPVAEPLEAGRGWKPTDLEDTRDLIDKRISGQYERQEAAAGSAPAPFQSYTVVDRDRGRSILLPRALSGLVDLVIMVLVTGALIIAADYFSGINVLDLRSLITFSVLLLFVYFLYTLFFLGISNQTVGMMIMNLQVITDTGDEGPKMPRILARSCCYLVSLLFLGIGLLWALFDPDHCCLHDRLTNTRAARVHGIPES